MSSSESSNTVPGGTGKGPPMKSGVSSWATMVSGSSVSEGISQSATGPSNRRTAGAPSSTSMLPFSEEASMTSTQLQPSSMSGSATSTVHVVGSRLHPKATAASRRTKSPCWNRMRVWRRFMALASLHPKGTKAPSTDPDSTKRSSPATTWTMGRIGERK